MYVQISVRCLFKKCPSFHFFMSPYRTWALDSNRLVCSFVFSVADIVSVLTDKLLVSVITNLGWFQAKGTSFVICWALFWGGCV